MQTHVASPPHHDPDPRPLASAARLLARIEALLVSPLALAHAQPQQQQQATVTALPPPLLPCDSPCVRAKSLLAHLNTVLKEIEPSLPATSTSQWLAMSRRAAALLTTINNSKIPATIPAPTRSHQLEYAVAAAAFESTGATLSSGCGGVGGFGNLVDLRRPGLSSDFATVQNNVDGAEISLTTPVNPRELLFAVRKRALARQQQTEFATASRHPQQKQKQQQRRNLRRGSAACIDDEDSVSNNHEGKKSYKKYNKNSDDNDDGDDCDEDDDDYENDEVDDGEGKNAVDVDAGIGDSATAQSLARHEKIQNQLAERISSLVATLRNQSLQFAENISADSKILESTRTALARNQSSMDTATTRLRTYSASSRSAAWTLFLVILFMCAVSCGMYIVIKIF